MGFFRHWMGIGLTAAILASAGNASAVPVTWDYTGSVALIGTGSQPVTVSSGGFDTKASAYSFVGGGGGSLTLTGRGLSRNPLTGIAVCNSLTESNFGCAQIDRIGLNDVMRIELPGPGWEALSAIVGIVTPIATPLDAFVLYGSNEAIPGNTSDLTLLLAGTINALGSNLGLGFWDIPINASNDFNYLFFTTAAANDGYSLVRLSAEQVPEPATLALFGAGLAGLGAIRRRKRKS